jgi:hypothetical protein
MLTETELIQQKTSNVRFFEQKMNSESQTDAREFENLNRVSPQKQKRAEKIFNSDLMKETLGKWEGNVFTEKREEGKKEKNRVIEEKKATQNKQRSCYRFKVSSDEKGFFYVD